MTTEEVVNMVFELDFQNTLQDLKNRRLNRLANENWLGINPDGNYVMLKTQSQVDIVPCDMEGNELMLDDDKLASLEAVKQHCYNCKYVDSFKCSILANAPIYKDDSCCKFEYK